MHKMWRTPYKSPKQVLRSITVATNLLWKKPTFEYEMQFSEGETVRTVWVTCSRPFFLFAIRSVNPYPYCGTDMSSTKNN